MLQTAPLTMLNFLLTIKISYFSFSRMRKFSDLTWHERRVHPTLTSFSVLAFLPLLQLLECLLEYMCGHNLTMKFPHDFHNYRGLKGLVSSLSSFTIAPPNKLILGCQPHWSTKRKKNNIISRSKTFHNITVFKGYAKKDCLIMESRFMLPSFGMNVWNHQIAAIFESSGGLLLLKDIYWYKVATKI